MIRAADVSNWQSDLTLDQLRRWRELGWEHLIVRGSLERPDMRAIAHRQLEMGARADMTLAVYPWAYPSVDDPESVAADAVREYGRHQPLVYWVDMEETEYVGSVSHNIAWLRRNLAAFDSLGVRAGIYTGSWWWGPYMGMTTGFSTRPLWDAYYTGNPSLGAPGYGGWEQRRGHQYWGSGTGKIDGYAVDLNVFDDEWLYGQAPEEPVTDEQMAEVQRIAQDEIIDNIQKALAHKRLPAEAREALTYGALPAAQTLARGDV